MPFDIDFSKFKGCNRALFVIRMFISDEQVEKESLAKVTITEDNKRSFIVKRPPDYQLPAFTKFILNTVSDEGEIKYEIIHQVKSASLKQLADCPDGRSEFQITLEEYV